MKVTRLPRDPGPAGWNRLLPDPDPPQVLEGAQTADWLVIGAGFAGLAAARRLAQLCPGDRIAVLEAHRVGDGPAGRNSGFMIDLPHDLASDAYGGALDADRATTRANRHAIAFAAAMAAEYALPTEAFDLRGKINAAATEAGERHNRAYAAHLTAMGEPHAMLDAADMRDLTGSAYYRGGLFTPGCAMLQPAMYIRGMAEGLASNRVTVFERSPVTALTRATDWTAETPLGRLTAPRVILAVNGHANSFGLFPGRLLHVFTYASMTRPLGADEVARIGGAPVWGVTPADPMGTTVRRISGIGGARIVIRNRFTCDPSMEVDDARIARIGRDHDRALAARFPALAGIDMAYRWGGRLCLSRNGVAAFGEVEPGLFSACCQNGLGTAKGTLHGLLAAEQAAGHPSALLDATLAAAPPRKLPPEPLARLGATATIRWQEWRAGQER
jgi:glycine/D-amino acid oxidase-like deaminating enzyme